MHVTIRKFRVGDEPALWQVFFTAIRITAADRYTDEQRVAWAPESSELDKWSDRVRRIDPFVAEVDHEIAGYADLQADGYIDHFFVAAAYNRQGVGTELMRQIHIAAKLQQLQTLYADVSLTAEPFFSHNGFIIERQQVVSIQSVTLRNMRMRKILLAPDDPHDFV